MNLIILPAIDLTVSIMFFYKVGFGIKQPTKFDMLLRRKKDKLM